jgi:long-chain acyl-CoA synthetase
VGRRKLSANPFLDAKPLFYANVAQPQPGCFTLPYPRRAALCHTERVRPHLATLVADFRRYGLQIAVVTHRGNRRFSSTYLQLAELSARCAHAFDQQGLQPGDRVLLWGANSVEWMAAFFGCILRGIVAVPLDAAGSLELAQRVVSEVQPRLLAGDLKLLQQLNPEPAIPFISFASFAATLPAPDYTPSPGLSRDTPLQIIFTSGTTAQPKGIVHTHGNVLASLDPLEQEIGKYLRYERFVHPLRILHTLPLSHVFGQFMGLWVPPLLAAEVHFEDRLQAPRLARLLRQERISVLAAVPRVLDLLRAWLEGEFPALPASLTAARGESIGKRWWRFRAVHVRLGLKFWAFVSGGATLPGDLETFWTTAGFALVQGYGMTETTALVTLNHPFKIARGSIGKPLAGREVRIGDDGEILVRGASIAAQVWRAGGLHSRDQADAGNWLATGDLAAHNEAGELVFAGRKSDVIVTSAGLNIHPQDLEAELRRQPGLRACLVVAYDSPAGPAPAAILIPEGNDSGDEILKSAVDHANRELAPFQQIRYWLRWPQLEFPLTSTGKVLRRSVQAWAQRSLATGTGAGVEPSDPLLAVLRQLGAANQEITGRDRLAEDLHLDSLAMVQLQSTLETQFGVELEDRVWERVKTVGDLRRLLHGNPAEAVSISPNKNRSAGFGRDVSTPRVQEASPAVSSQRTSAVFPRWPGWVPVRLLRTIFLECIARPLVWLLLAPRIAPPISLIRPSLLVANHLTAFDVPVILYALSSTDREHVAVAMSGALLTGWRRGKAQRHRILGALTPLAYGLVTALFNVFPLPRGAGLRQSFAHAGDAMDHGLHVLVFPEGHRSADGRLQPFEPGIGLLAQESEVPVQPIFIAGLGWRDGKRWPKRGTVTVRLGTPLAMEAGEEPQAFAKRLQAAVAALGKT